MKYFYVAFLIIVIKCFSPQTKRHSTPIQFSLKGLWYSTDDHNSKMFFTNNTYYLLYEKDTIRSATFVLSDSCKINEKVQRNNEKLILVIYDDKSIIECNKILGLTNQDLTLMDLSTGQIFHFRKKQS